MSIRTLLFVLGGFVFFDTGFWALNGATAKPAVSRGTRRVAKSDGVSVHYARLALPRGRRSVGRERKTLCTVDAEFHSRVALAYQRSALPAGRYRLEVRTIGGRDDRDDGEACHLVFRARAPRKKSAEEKDLKAAGRKGRKAASSHDDAKRPVLLSVPLKARVLKESRQELEVELKPFDKGKRMHLIFRIGRSEQVATVRVPLPLQKRG